MKQSKPSSSRMVGAGLPLRVGFRVSGRIAPLIADAMQVSERGVLAHVVMHCALHTRAPRSHEHRCCSVPGVPLTGVG
jgi:hypothetical protein